MYREYARTGVDPAAVAVEGAPPRIDHNQGRLVAGALEQLRGDYRDSLLRRTC
jgi:hypothetical protein